MINFHLEIWTNKDDKDYPFKDESVDVNGFLAENSKLDYGEDCLGYVMTYRCTMYPITICIHNEYF